MADYTKVVDHFSALYQRWQDEHAHEDFADYVNSMVSQLPKGARDISMTSDPFVCRYSLAGQLLYLKASAFGVRYTEPQQIPQTQAQVREDHEQAQIIRADIKRMNGRHQVPMWQHRRPRGVRK